MLLQLLVLLVLLYLMLLLHLVLLLLLKLDGTLLVVDTAGLEDKVNVGLATLSQLHPMLGLYNLLQLSLLYARHWNRGRAACGHVRRETSHGICRALNGHPGAGLLVAHSNTMRSTRRIRTGSHAHRIGSGHLRSDLRRYTRARCRHSLVLRTGHHLLLIVLVKMKKGEGGKGKR